MNHLRQKQRKVHPKDKNSIASNVFFLYALKLFKKGFKKDLEETDLYEVPYGCESKRLGDQLEKEWENQKKSGLKLSIVNLLLKCYGFPLLLLGFLQLVLDIAEVLITPYTLGKVVSYFTLEKSNISKENAYCYATILISFNLFYRIYLHNYLWALQELGIKIRTAFCSFLYRKALKLSPAHSEKNSIGNIVTLITKDVQTFEAFIFFANDAWIGILKTIVAALILYLRIGSAAFVGVAIFVILMPIQVYLGAKVTSLKMTACKKTDERLQLTQETLSAIKIIKMYNWENIFSKKISSARRNEVHETFKIFFLKFSILVLSDLDSYIAFYVMLVTYVHFGHKVTAEIVFVMMSTFETLIIGLSFLFPVAVYQTAELKSAIKRMGIVAKTPELQFKETVNSKINSPKIELEDVTVEINNQKIIDNVNLTIEKGLTILVGPVGCGKSFLLKTILQQNEFKGRLSVEGTISYASQEPWLFPSTIKQNILFGQKYNEKRYQEVLKVCTLIYDLELLAERDGTIVEDRGINLSKGQQARINLARALYKESDIYLLDDSLAALDAHVTTHVFEEGIRKFLNNKLVILVTQNNNFLKKANKVVMMNQGRVKMNVEPSELKNTKDLDDIIDGTNKNIPGNLDTIEDEDLEEDSKLLPESAAEKGIYHENKKSGIVDFRVYYKYVKFGGGFIALFLVFCLFVSTQATMRYADILISHWVNVEEKLSNATTLNSSAVTEDAELLEQRTAIFYWYNAMAIITAITALSKAAGLFLFTRKSSIELHKTMIKNVVNADMKFFDRNFIGNILNRFSKDLAAVDERIPILLHQVFGIIPQITGLVIVIASVNLIFLIPCATVFAILVVLRRCCLRTARSLKRLDALTRSPVVGHVNATLEGLTTVRAFKVEKILRDEFDRHQDLYTSANYLLQSSMRAFALILGIICSCFIAIIVTTFLINENRASAGNVGIAIMQTFFLTGVLQWGIGHWTEAAYQMTSVERVLEYSDIKQENKKGLHLANWPERGEISFNSVSLSYIESSEPMLKNITFAVGPREKIGIVGRTGAGKSSIISALFRLYDFEGKIEVDGADIKTLSLDFLRSNISIIPQDPVLFSGTVRYNIDPAGAHSDQQIWKAVETAAMKKMIPSLDFEIVDGGSSLSIGQKQLICLARAIIRQNKIIVLDEATANVDPETDDLIHATIREHFASCTVFTIAHKLHYVLYSDKILVMDKGKVVEYDKPVNLLKDNYGVFYRMVVKAGLLASARSEINMKFNFNKMH